MKESLKNRICELCGATISLAKTGQVGFKWVTNPEKPKDSWRCLPTNDYPVRAHSPTQERVTS